MVGIFLIAVALSPILTALVALRIRPLRALQRIAEKPDPAREAELDDYAKRLARKHNHHN